MDIQSRNPVVDTGWRGSAARSAGLYGELPALPAHAPARTTSPPKPLRKTVAAE